MNSTGEICPWSHLEPSTLEWCERRLCAWISEPANTWSNIIFIVVGILILIECRKRNLGSIKLLGAFSILLGFMSGFYHATASLIGELVDFSSMFLISVFLISANYARVKNWSQTKTFRFAATLTFFTLLTLFLYPVTGPFLFATQVVWASALEYIEWRKSPRKPQYKWFIWSFCILQVAFLIWNLDRLKILCDPDNHSINGHATWHILTGISIWMMSKFYSQFKGSDTTSAVL